MDEVYVVEVSTTGPKGAPADAVAQIAVCRMLPDGSDFDTVYDATVAMDPKDLGKESLDHLSGCFGINPEDLYLGEDLDRVVRDVQEIIFGKECTSYNVGNVFGKHLSFEPWDATRNLTLLPSLSVRLPGDLRGPPEQEHILIRRAYGSICPGDPAGIREGNHAIDLAQMAASVAAALRREGILGREHGRTFVRDPERLLSLASQQSLLPVRS